MWQTASSTASPCPTGMLTYCLCVWTLPAIHTHQSPCSPLDDMMFKKLVLAKLNFYCRDVLPPYKKGSDFETFGKISFVCLYRGSILYKLPLDILVYHIETCFIRLPNLGRRGARTRQVALYFGFLIMVQGEIITQDGNVQKI